MSDIVAFLLARIAEDEAAALDPASANWQAKMLGGGRATVVNAAGHPILAETTSYVADHVARWHPARVLAECEAKRRIVQACAEILSIDGWEYTDAPNLARDILEALALPYGDRPDFDPAWRVAGDDTAPGDPS